MKDKRILHVIISVIGFSMVVLTTLHIIPNPIVTVTLKALMAAAEPDNFLWGMKSDISELSFDFQGMTNLFLILIAHSINIAVLAAVTGAVHHLAGTKYVGCQAAYSHSFKH